MAYSYAWKEVFNPGDARNFFQAADHHCFVPDAPTFSRTNAWWLSEISRLIYVKGEGENDLDHQMDIRNGLMHEIGLEEQWFYNGEHVQCAIITTTPRHEQQFSVLVFRGTQGRIANWVYNLATALSPWPAGGSVHRGFKLLLMEVWEFIESQLNKLAGPVYYTGHSLGGALAVLAASLKKPAAAYTFGSPRMGNSQFVDSTRHINIYRVVNPRDIVSCVPPIPGFLHVGEPHCLASSKTASTSRCWFDAPGFLADHSPANYSVLL